MTEKQDYISEEIEDLGIDLGNYQSEIDIFRIHFSQASLFPCDGYGFLCEKENIILYDALGRRIGTLTDLESYLESRGLTPPSIQHEKSLHENLYHVVCRISYKEMQEAKKINLELVKHKIINRDSTK